MDNFVNNAICEFELCTGCGVCLQSCPLHCISMQEYKDGFLYPIIDNERCIHCNRCRSVCPVNKKIPTNDESEFFMGWHKDIEVLAKSSSGGAFTAIASFVLDKKGVVYGACFDDETFAVKHTSIDSIDDLDKLRLSKYYQSQIEDAYIEIKEILKSGRIVLFSGTACQIAGLYSYLNCDYENLITVDVLCHGVASKKIIKAYIRSKEKRYKKKVKSFKFRLKPEDSDWQKGGGTRMKIEFIDGTYSIEDKDKDTFFVGFNKYLFLRNSCYNCQYIGIRRVADITLADFWGVDLKTIPERQRRYGVSLILANSDKGKSLVDDLKKDMMIYPADKQRAIRANQALEKPSSINKNREIFFEKVDSQDFDRLIKKYEWHKYFQYYRKKLVVGIIGEKNYSKLKMKLGRA